MQTNTGQINLWWVALLALILSGCAASRPFVSEEYTDWQETEAPSDIAYRVFLLGNAGSTEADPAPVLSLLKAQLDTLGENAAVIFLGDNASCCGLPTETDAGRRAAEDQLRAQLEAVKDFPGRIIFMPGDRDWDRSREDGRAALARQEQFIETYLKRDDVFLPDSGFPGPAAVDLTDAVTLIALDTQWWLHRYDKPYGDAGSYELNQDEDFLLELDDLVKRNRKKRLLVVGHHPIYSSGTYAGQFPWRAHLFPLTEINKRAYLPLPVVGSLPLLYVQHFGGSRQDLAHPRYKSFREALARIFTQHDELIYASAHEHSLQYFRKGTPGRNQQHFLVSGTASEAAHVARGRDAVFAARKRGFTTLAFYWDGTVWMEMWSAEGRPGGQLVFRTELAGPNPDVVDPLPAADAQGACTDYTDSTVVVAANPGYMAGRLHRLIYGRHYRKEWATPVEVPVLDLHNEAGGLTVVRRGTGMWTSSLRFADAHGMQYVGRSIVKDPSGAMPPHLRSALAVDLARDFTSSMHPYGALIIPPLAEAAGIYHATPKVVFASSDPCLGIYREEFEGHLMLFEERPDDDMSAAVGFGRSTKVIGASKLYREINGDNDHRVDQRAFARARLFDLLIADWDRHNDQWRWAAFEPPDSAGKIYRPIPRDRDWAFSRYDGLVPSAMKYAMPQYQGFGYRYGDLKGLSAKGAGQDHRFTAALTRTDWIEIADSLRRALPDGVIEAAVQHWPAPIYALRGSETASMLKARRDQLPQVAERFYRLHARAVDVVGSDKHERFEVNRLNDDDTQVIVYKTSKDGDIRKEIYRRTFHSSETTEIRLYGLDGHDQFIIEGEVGAGIRVRAIGGAGHDTFVDRSRVSGMRKKTHFYDTAEGTTWEAVGPETKIHRSSDPAVNAYTGSYPYDRDLPLVFLGSNKDDGLILGGGVYRVRQGFRKTPYARTHRITANVATRTGGVDLAYQGHYVGLVDGWDLAVDASARSPNSVRNYYGLGNETEKGDRSTAYYEAQVGQAQFAPLLLRRVGEGVTVRMGPSLSVTHVRDDEQRQVSQPQPGLSPNVAGITWTTGLQAALVVDGRDDPVNARQGLHWVSSVDLRADLSEKNEAYSMLRSVLSVYATPLWAPQVTLAFRVGGDHNVGAFPFYEASTLGGKDNLRGYRSTRFSGRTSFYQNAEVRVGLFKFSTYAAPGRVGLLGFIDNGRVWTDGERSRVWHQGYGGGLWMILFDRLALTGTLGLSDEDTTFAFKFGFFY